MSCETCGKSDVQVLLDALAEDKKDRQKTRRVCVICAAVCAVSMIALVGLLGLFAAGLQIENTTTTTTTTTEQTVEGDSAVINNVDGEQYNDSAVNGSGN